MAKLREYRWYVHARDAHTNEVFGKNLGSSDDVFGHHHTAEGNKPLYETDRETVAYLKRGRDTLNISFDVYVQEGNGQIRLSKGIDGAKKPKPKRWPRFQRIG